MSLRFNSILVRLKDCSRICFEERAGGDRFNSILVRLKVVLGAITGPVSILNKFQFHTGSIKRLYESRSYIIRDPYGTCQDDFHDCCF